VNNGGAITPLLYTRMFIRHRENYIFFRIMRKGGGKGRFQGPYRRGPRQRSVTGQKVRGRVSNRSQMDVKRKTCDIRTWKKYLLLDISSTNTDTLVLVLSLYQLVETRSIDVF
jgi:hypothetical protein